MDLPLGILIGIIFGLVILSAFFSGSETSLTAASKARMHALKKSGNKEASNYEKIFNDKERLICTILLANNLVNILASSIATTILLKFFDTDGIAYTTIIMTFMILLFGELLPKTIALSNADKIALKISGFFKVLMFIFFPITGFLNSIVGFIIKNTRINEPLMPGRIIAEIAIAPDRNINIFVFGVDDGAWRAIYDAIESPITNESNTAGLIF